MVIYLTVFFFIDFIELETIFMFYYKIKGGAQLICLFSLKKYVGRWCNYFSWTSLSCRLFNFPTTTSGCSHGICIDFQTAWSQFTRMLSIRQCTKELQNWFFHLAEKYIKCRRTKKHNNSTNVEREV